MDKEMTRQDIDRSHHLGNQNLIRTSLVQLFSNFGDIVLERRFVQKIKGTHIRVTKSKTRMKQMQKATGEHDFWNVWF